MTSAPAALGEHRVATGVPRRAGCRVPRTAVGAPHQRRTVSRWHGAALPSLVTQRRSAAWVRFTQQKTLCGLLGRMRTHTAHRLTQTTHVVTHSWTRSLTHTAHSWTHTDLTGCYTDHRLLDVHITEVDARSTQRLTHTPHKVRPNYKQ